MYFSGGGVHLQGVDVDGRSPRPVHRVVGFTRRLLSLFLLQSFLLRGHFGFFLLDQFGTVQYHLPSTRPEGGAEGGVSHMT